MIPIETLRELCSGCRTFNWEIEVNENKITPSICYFADIPLQCPCHNCLVKPICTKGCSKYFNRWHKRRKKAVREHQ